MFIKVQMPPKTSGFTLTEVMISASITSLLFLCLASFSMYGSRVFAALANYSQVESSSRLTLDSVSQQIRQSKGLLTFATNSVTVQDTDGAALQFSYDPSAKTLTRIKNGVSRVLLTGCQQLRFDMFQRTPINGSFDAYSATSVGTGKMIQVTWVCSRNILGGTVNSDSVQSAKIVIRKNAGSL